MNKGGRPPRNPKRLYKDKQWLIENYIINGLGIKKMAKMANCSYSSVRDHLLLHGIPLKINKVVTKKEKARWCNEKTNLLILFKYLSLARKHINKISSYDLAEGAIVAARSEISGKWKTRKGVADANKYAIHFAGSTERTKGCNTNW